MHCSQMARFVMINECARSPGAKLVGRERIMPEYMNHFVVADHWVKGPHHFWVDVATNQVRPSMYSQ